MKQITCLGLFVLICGILFSSCGEDAVSQEFKRYEDADYEVLTRELNLPQGGLSYDLNFPDYYSRIGFGSNPTPQDVDMVTLGRVLFYDVNLSKDRSVSCASCHDQSLAFSDDVSLSMGVEQRSGSRNSIALGSVFSFSEYYGQETSPGIPFLWDNSATTPQEQIHKAIANENEMGMTIQDIYTRTKDEPHYQVLHKYAFGPGEVKPENMIDALAAFVNSIASFDSKLDDAIDSHLSQGKNFDGSVLPNDMSMLSSKENQGLQIYKANCGSCHGELMNAPSRLAENNGLDSDIGEDLGVGGINGSYYDRGKFKVPTLRNIALTAPYMHDGRFQTLEQVVDHYSTGIQDHPNLSYDLRSGSQATKFNYTENQKEALIAFLNTLTDNKLITDEKYSNPFK